MQTLQYIDDRSMPRQADWDIRAAVAALDLYRSVLWRARLRRWWSALTRRSYSLLSLNQVEATRIVRGNQFAGVCTVPICQIRGTECRYEDFDANFRPLNAPYPV